MKTLSPAEEPEHLKWRFYHASHVPDLDTSACLDLVSSSSLQVEDLTLADQVRGQVGSMHHHSGLLDYDLTSGQVSSSPRHTHPVKALHDLSLVFPDTDSGFGSYKSRGRQLEELSPRLPRSRSLSRLNGLTTQDMSDILQDKPVRHVHSQLQDSEARRTVLVHKLKEAQATLQLQNDRLSKIENSAKDNSVLVEDLKFKEREHRKKIAQLQSSEEEKQMLQMENLRLREEMQHRIDTLDFRLKSLKNQHLSTESENDQRVGLLDQTTAALVLMEQENAKLQMDRDKLREEIGVMKEAFQLSKTRYSSIEEEHKTHRVEGDRLREENLGLNNRVHEMAGQMIELRTLLQAVKDENERLSSSWKSASEDKSRTSRQVEGFQDSLSDLKARLSAAVADKDRLFQERLELHSKVQRMILDREQLLKAQMVLEEQVVDQQKLLEKTQGSTSHQDNRRKYILEDELSAVKKVSEDLSSELSSVKAFYERALEQLSASEKGKKVLEQQLQLAEQERKRLQGDLDRLNQIGDSRHHDEREERQHLEDTVLRMRTEMKDIRYNKEQLANKCQELEAKLRKANDEIRGGIGRQHEDLEAWKTACDRLTASVTRKETELQNLTDKCHSLENQLSRMQDDLRKSREKEDTSTDLRDDLDRLRHENRRLLQEKAENEQMLQLLETQRDVLTKSTESGLNKLQDVEQLSGKVDQMRNENELLRQRISELEKVRDNLIKQKEELLASSELIYKSQGLEELEGKMEELRDANRQLRDINEVMASKLQIVEQENLRLKQSMADGSSKEQVRRLQEENSHLLGENSRLQMETQGLASQRTKDSDASAKEQQNVRRERDALQKQVQLISGQLNLLEGSKKRSEDTAQRTRDELTQVRSQLDTTRKECSEARRVASQVKSLSEELQRAKNQQESQEKLIRSLKEELEEERSKKPAVIQESLEGVGAELQQMNGQLHKLMREIENKEQSIERLEGELRTAKDTTDAKEHTVSELKKLVSDLEEQNATLKSSLDLKQPVFSESRPALAFKAGERSLKEELEEAVKNKQEADRVAEEAKLSVAGKSSLSVEKPASRTPSPLNMSSPQLPQFVLTAPSSSSEDESVTATSGRATSPEGYPRTSSPLWPASPAKKFTPDSPHRDSAPSGHRKTGQVSAHSFSSREPTPKALLSHVSLQSSGTGSDLKVNRADRASEVRKTSSSVSDNAESSFRKGEDSVDFPPVTPPPVQETQPRLAFAKPQPASKTKTRKLPQIKVPVSGHVASPLTRHTTESAAEGRGDGSQQKSQLPVTPKTPVRPKPSPRESRNLFMSRKELTGKPSKLLSDSGIMVIATKTGSSQNPSSDVKYVVKKQDSADRKDLPEVVSPPSTGQDSLLQSFDKLLSGDGGSLPSAVLSSGSSKDREQASAETSQTSAQSFAKQSRGEDQSVAKSKSESAYSKLKKHSPSPQPVWKSAATSESSPGQETSTSPLTSPTPAKSTSVKDFLTSFSAGGKKAEGGKEPGKGGAHPAEEKFKPTVKPFVSRFAGRGQSTKTSSAEDLTTSGSLESVLPTEDSEKQKLAELIVSLASEPSFSSSLSSTDSWTLLLEETAGEKTLSYDKLEELAHKAKASTDKRSREASPKAFADKRSSEASPKAFADKKAKSSAQGGGKGESKGKGGVVRSSSTSSLSSNGNLAGIMRQSLEEGQPVKFKPTTGTFLSKSLGHPISALASQTEPAASGTGESGDRLQSLISKYRSHSSDSAPGGTGTPGGGVRGREETSAPPALRGGVTSPRGRGFTPGTPKAPLLRPGSEDTSSDRPLKKLSPPAPPPKPGKSLMKSLSGAEASAGAGARAEGVGQSGEIPLDSQEQSDINALIQKYLKVLEM